MNYHLNKIPLRVITKLLSVIFISIILQSCGQNQANATNSANSTGQCMTCHSGTTDVGKKILSAGLTYHDGVEANGQRVPVIDSWYTWDPITSTNILQQAISNFWYWAGSVATYANGSNCQQCHTHDGFVNQVTGVYDSLAASQGISVDQVRANELLPRASAPGCFTCHNPHENGNLSLRVANGTQVTTQTGVTYSKSRGNTCISCHEARLTKGRTEHCSSSDGRISSQLQPLDTAGLPTAATVVTMGSFSPHHGAESDVSIGVQKDTLTGSYKGAGSMYAMKQYSNSQHSTMDGANCVSCHMTLRTDMMSHMSSYIAGHTWQITGPVADGRRANLGGCEGCHNPVASAGPVTISAAQPALASDVTGYKRTDRFYFTSNLTGVPVKPADKMDAILVKLADPATGCSGFIQTVYGLLNTLSVVNGGTAGTINWNNTMVKKCNIKSYTGTLPSVNDLTNAPYSTRLLQAIWNFELLSNSDQSMGVHNMNYSLQLLYDSCEDLHNLRVTLDSVYAGSGTTLDMACNTPGANRPAGVPANQL